MTAPTSPLPPLVVDAAPASPQTGGLYGAATLLNLPDPSRMAGGALIVQVNTGGHGTWPDDCATVPADKVKGGERGADVWAPPLTVWAADDCNLVGSSEEDARRRAELLLTLFEPVDVEADTAARLLTDAGTPATAATVDAFITAVGTLEAALGRTGVPGVIHARRSLAAVAAAHQLALPGPTGTLVTPLGNRWAFGGGYDALGDTLVATGPVTIRRSAAVTSVGLAPRRNDRLVVSEREVTVSWELGAHAANIA